MRENFLPFCVPSITERDVKAVTDVLTSGWITTGKKNARFEEDFCAYTGSEHSVALASATAGMHLLLKALNIGPGDEVITASMTWVSTVNLIALSGATPVFADVDRDTLMVTPESVKARLSDKTRLIIPVHYAGAPADLDGLREVATAAGVPLVEDAAHAIGTRYRDQHIAAQGTAIFSFHPIKNITTGEGGMFCTDDPNLAERIRRLKFHGLGVDAFDRQTQGRAPQAEVLEPGFKYNMTDISAALGIEQLARVDEFNRLRREHVQAYREKLAGIDELMPLAEPLYPGTHAWHLFIVRLDIDKVGMSRREFMEALKQRNIGTGLHFLAAHTQKYYRENMPQPEGLLANTEWNSDRILSLPLFPDLTSEDINDVVDAIKDVLAN
jgi:UDP-4-amino-4-deoxy-L-arabinose-oxoglutarate aminotransferase